MQGVFVAMTTEVVSSHICPTCFQYHFLTQSLLSCALLGATKMAEPEDEGPPVLLPCSVCSRTFKPESLQKHLKVCEKQASKKRKVFDSSKQRIQGTELAEFLPKILREKKTEKVVPKKPESNWKEKHLEFVAAIRAARGVEPVPTTKSSSAVSKSSNEKCPHCDRNFGPKAFDRHIEWCKEQKARIPKSPASLIQAKERLEARTKYRAPPLAKSKRTLTREKYARVSQHSSKESSPLGSRSAVAFSKPQPQEVKVPETTSRIPGIRNKPKLSSSSPSCTLPSGNTQVKRREPSPSPSKRPFRSGSKTARKGPVKAKNEESSSHASLFTSSCNITKIKPSEERHKAREVKPNPVENSSSEEVYDPYISAERQMMELLSQGDFTQLSPRHNKTIPSSHAESSTVFPSFESSHRSAFVSPEPPRLFSSSKSHLEKGDADKRINEEAFTLKSESSVSSELFAQLKSHSAGGKFSADSAYGSLNRRSPTHSTGKQMPGKHEEIEGDRLCFMSSSSSESSLPPLCSVQVVKREASNPSLSPSPPHAVDASPVLQSAPRMSKFCHECGSKYPVSLAKFCCECGVRRLAM